MALLLRKMCQPKLDAAFMFAFHADIDDSSKNLFLYTQCGKPFASVHGVRFATTRPTHAEMEYAVDLLVKWLRKNKTTIQDYITAYKVVEQEKEKGFDPDLGKGWKILCSTSNEWAKNRRTHVKKLSGYSIYNDDESFKFDLNHRLVSWDCKSPTFTRDPFKKFGLPSDIIRAGRRKCAEYLNIQESKDLLEELHAEMNSCKE